MSKVLPPFTFMNLHALLNASRASMLGTQTAKVLKNAIKLYETAQTREEAIASLQVIADIIKRDANEIDPLLAKASGNFLGGTRRFQTPERLRAELAEALKYQVVRKATAPDWSKHIWENSPTLRSYKLPPQEKDPVFHALSFLISRKAQIDTELRKKFSFGYLMQVLTTQKKISGNPQTYQRAGGALDLFFAKGNPMQYLKEGELKTSEEAARWVLNHKQELDSLTKQVETYSYATLMDALVYGGRVQGNPQAYQRAGGSLDLFFTEGNPMQHLTEGELKNPQEAARWIMNHKQELDSLAKQVKAYSYGTLMDSLFYGGRVQGNLKNYQWAGSALELFLAKGNPMQDLKEGELKTPEEAVEWIFKHKQTLDSLAKKVEAYSYATLMNALFYGGRVQGNLQNYQWAGSTIQYLFKKWDQIGPLVVKVYLGEKMSPQERDQFTTLKGDQPISKTYRNAIIRWGRFLVKNGLNPLIH